MSLVRVQIFSQTWKEIPITIFRRSWKIGRLLFTVDSLCVYMCVFVCVCLYMSRLQKQNKTKKMLLPSYLMDMPSL